MLTLPFPEMGIVMPPLTMLAVVEWSPTINMRAIEISKFIIKPAILRSNMLIHKVFCPVTSAFLIIKFTLKNFWIWISISRGNLQKLSASTHPLNSELESIATANSSMRQGSIGPMPESGHPQRKLTLSLWIKSIKCWLMLVGGTFLPSVEREEFTSEHWKWTARHWLKKEQTLKNQLN